LVRAGLIQPNEVNEIMRVVIDIRAGDMPIMYVQRDCDSFGLAVALGEDGIRIERRDRPDG